MRNFNDLIEAALDAATSFEREAAEAALISAVRKERCRERALLYLNILAGGLDELLAHVATYDDDDTSGELRSLHSDDRVSFEQVSEEGTALIFVHDGMRYRVSLEVELEEIQPRVPAPPRAPSE